jgi:DNA-binding NarL/FixJ family response regulator
VIRILLADDQTLIRAGFRALLTAEPDMEVVAECGTGRDAVRLAARERPDVVLMDIRMPETDGLEATRKIMADRGLAGTRIIILTTFELDEYIAEAVRAGAAGFLVKDTEPEELLRAVRVVHDGDALLSPSVTRRIMAQLALQSRATAAPVSLANITEREREVLRLVGEGLNNAEIAERLVITPLTAKTHVSRIMTKLLVRDRAQLVVLAYESGLVRPGWPAEAAGPDSPAAPPRVPAPRPPTAGRAAARQGPGTGRKCERVRLEPAGSGERPAAEAAGAGLPAEYAGHPR